MRVPVKKKKKDNTCNRCAWTTLQHISWKINFACFKLCKLLLKCKTNKKKHQFKNLSCIHSMKIQEMMVADSFKSKKKTRKFLQKFIQGLSYVFRAYIFAKFYSNLMPRPKLTALAFMQKQYPWPPKSKKLMEMRTGRHRTSVQHISDITDKKSWKMTFKFSICGVKLWIKCHLFHIFGGIVTCC